VNVLVAGIGNIFFGDDGFGVEVIKQMKGVAVPAGVKVEDFGIRGVHLSYELLDDYDALVLIDAMPMGEEPGTVAIFEPDLEAVEASSADAHSMNPAVVLGMLANMGGNVPYVVIVGCEPLVIEEGIGLSEPVAAAVGPAIATVHEVLNDIFANHQLELEELPS